MRISDREFNRLRVLKALRRAEPISRTGLASLCGLDGATITDISAALLERGLIQEEKVATGKRGRPQRHLRINPQGAFGLGAYIGIHGQFICEIVNLRGDQVHISASPLPSTHSMAELADVMSQRIGDAIATSGVSKSALSCVGLALPALVDADRGVLRWVQTIATDPYPTARHIASALGVPVFLDNNTSVLARAEHWFGEVNDLDDFTLLNLGYGISAASYAGGALVLGKHSLNSEAGHSKIVVEHGRPCVCGASGCLDAYCSIVALVQQGCEITGRPSPELADMDAFLTEFLAQADGGHEALASMFARAVRYLGVTIGNVINTRDPGRVIVLCEHPAIPALYNRAVGPIEQACLPAMRGITCIEFRAFEHDLFRKGAAALVLEQLYKSL